LGRLRYHPFPMANRNGEEQTGDLLAGMSFPAAIFFFAPFSGLMRPRSKAHARHQPNACLTGLLTVRSWLLGLMSCRGWPALWMGKSDGFADLSSAWRQEQKGMDARLREDRRLGYVAVSGLSVIRQEQMSARQRKGIAGA